MCVYMFRPLRELSDGDRRTTFGNDGHSIELVRVQVLFPRPPDRRITMRNDDMDLGLRGTSWSNLLPFLRLRLLEDAIDCGIS
jgi:hypothetical protein